MKIKEVTTINSSKVYLDTIKLFRHVMLMSEKMSKIHRHLLGESMISRVVSMISDITAAAITRDPKKRLDLLDDFMTELNVLSALVTGLVELRQVCIKHESTYAELSEEIGKQVNSWRIKTAERVS